MKSNVILEVPLRVDSSDFLHLDVPIADLDEVVTSERELRFTLDYPFEKPYAGTIKTASGATRRQVIEAIRAGFRTMYAATTAAGGPYGRAHQQLDHLFVDRIALDDDVLEILVTT
jgi:hypothetical protein